MRSMQHVNIILVFSTKMQEYHTEFYIFSQHTYNQLSYKLNLTFCKLLLSHLFLLSYITFLYHGTTPNGAKLPLLNPSLEYTSTLEAISLASSFVLATTAPFEVNFLYQGSSIVSPVQMR